MKVLKEGKIVDTFVGCCELCGAVFESGASELETTSGDSGDFMYFKLCPFCKECNVLFFRSNTKEAKAIIRKNKIESDVGIYAPGTK